MKEYRVVYNYNEFTIEAGQNRWIPSKEIADKILKYQQSKPYFRNTELYLEERERTEPIDKADCRTYQGKTVYNPDWLYFDALEIGDYVEAEVVDNFMNMLPPACWRSDCAQIGEPASHMLDERDGKCKATYQTFKRVAKDTWEYCGDCFRGENVKRGKEIQYV